MDDSSRFLIEPLDAFGSGRRRDRLVAIGREEVREDHLIHRVIFDDENLLHGSALPG